MFMVVGVHIDCTLFIVFVLESRHVGLFCYFW